MQLKSHLLFLSTFASVLLFAQNAEDNIKSKGFPKMPFISNTNIPGAPILQQPILLTGTTQEIRTEKHGLAYPVFFDWNKDGLMDLLVGEFETGEKGSYIKVYINEGSKSKPVFSGKYTYAKDIAGDTITVYQWCCIGIHPRFVDIDKDGYTDMLTGQYFPGKVSWWKGSKDGFEPKKNIQQLGYKQNDKYSLSSDISQLDTNAHAYWNYTSASFADFNGDGLEDLFVGGFGELRVALNTGTKELPVFGLRKYLLDLNDLPIAVVDKKLITKEYASKNFVPPYHAGVIKSFITPFDWDGDGVLDLLVTHVYADNITKDPIVFFKGVNTNKGLRFEKAQSLFTAKDVVKTFPGCQPNLSITDYNNDGIPDLLIGLSLPTINGNEIDSLVAWSYLHDLKVNSPGKDAGRSIEWEGSLEALRKKIEARPDMRSYYMGKLTDYKYLSLRHRGYVYLMLGKKNDKKGVRKKIVLKEKKQPQTVVPKNTRTSGSNNDPVKYAISTPAILKANDTGTIELLFSFKKGWHAYADTKANNAAGWIPTSVEFIFPKELEKAGDMQTPLPSIIGGSEVFTGDKVRFAQQFKIQQSTNKIPAGFYNIEVAIKYQVCDDIQCLPPQEEKITMKVQYSNIN